MKIPLESVIIMQSATIKDALETINNAGYGFSIVVSSNDSKVFGIVTDGDIRRAILKGINITASVETVVNRNYIYLLKDNYIAQGILQNLSIPKDNHRRHHCNKVSLPD